MHLPYKVKSPPRAMIKFMGGHSGCEDYEMKTNIRYFNLFLEGKAISN